MNYRIFWVVIALSISALSWSQVTNQKDNLFTLKSKNNNEYKIGGYIDLTASFAEIMDRDAAWFSMKVVAVVNKKWGVGVYGAALNYDHELTELVEEGTYRLQAWHSGLVLEHIFTITSKTKGLITWKTGVGNVMYELEYPQSEMVPWYQEIIDTEKFASNELVFEINRKIGDKWWLGFHGGYRITSDIHLLGTDKKFLQTDHYGVSIKYGIF